MLPPLFFDEDTLMVPELVTMSPSRNTFPPSLVIPFASMIPELLTTDFFRALKAFAERITTPSSALMMFLFSINEFNVPTSTE